MVKLTLSILINKTRLLKYLVSWFKKGIINF